MDLILYRRSDLIHPPNIPPQGGKGKCIIRIVCIIASMTLLMLGCNPSSRTSGNAAEDQSIDADSTLQKDFWVAYTYPERRGKVLYEQYCSNCHGVEGGGDGLNAYTLDPRPRRLADSVFVSVLYDSLLSRSIAVGGRGIGRSVLMPAYTHTLKVEEISFIVDYIRTLSSKQP
ncbi:MAG: cytochrome c [bacterium]